MPDLNYYDLLEVSLSATPKEIREGYRLAVSMVHPDRFEVGSREHERALAKSRAINEAYETLKDSGSRAQYDARLAAKRYWAARSDIKPEVENSDGVPGSLHTFMSGRAASANAPKRYRTKDKFALRSLAIVSAVAGVVSLSFAIVASDLAPLDFRLHHVRQIIEGAVLIVLAVIFWRVSTES